MIFILFLIQLFWRLRFAIFGATVVLFQTGLAVGCLASWLNGDGASWAFASFASLVLLIASIRYMLKRGFFNINDIFTRF